MINFGLYTTNNGIKLGNDTIAMLKDLADAASSNPKETISGSGAVSAELTNGVFYIFENSVTSLTLTVVPVESNVLPIYSGRFTTASNLSNPFTLSVMIKNGGTITNYANGSVTYEAGKTYEFYIVNGIISISVISPSGLEEATTQNLLTLTCGRGSLQQALNTAEENKDTFFQWMLDDTDENDIAIKKMIWHIPRETQNEGDNGYFIDALGCVIKYLS